MSFSQYEIKEGQETASIEWSLHFRHTMHMQMCEPQTHKIGTDTCFHAYITVYYKKLR